MGYGPRDDWATALRTYRTASDRPAQLSVPMSRERGGRSKATITTQFTGEFKSNPVLQARFMELVRAPSAGFSL